MSGAVGTYADIDPYVEEYVCKKMGLTPEIVATQVVQRDHHAEYITTHSVSLRAHWHRSPWKSAICRERK